MSDVASTSFEDDLDAALASPPVAPTSTTTTTTTTTEPPAAAVPPTGTTVPPVMSRRPNPRPLTTTTTGTPAPAPAAAAPAPTPDPADATPAWARDMQREIVENLATSIGRDINRVDERVGEVSTKMEGIDGRLQAVEADIKTLRDGGVDQFIANAASNSDVIVQAVTAGVSNAMAGMTGRVDQVEATANDAMSMASASATKVTGLESRVATLETNPPSGASYSRGAVFAGAILGLIVALWATDANEWLTTGNTRQQLTVHNQRVVACFLGIFLGAVLGMVISAGQKAKSSSKGSKLRDRFQKTTPAPAPAPTPAPRAASAPATPAPTTVVTATTVTPPPARV